MVSRTQRVWLVAFWLSVITGVVVSLWPGPAMPEPWFPSADKVQHAVAYAVLAWLGLQAGYRSKRWLASGLLALGGAIEVAQGLTETRTAEWLDWLADAAGIAAGLAIASWHTRARSRSAALEQVHRR